MPKKRVRELPCSDCRTIVLTSHSSVLCERCLATRRSAYCGGCGGKISQNEFTPIIFAHSRQWHTHCFAILHPADVRLQQLDEQKNPMQANETASSRLPTVPSSTTSNAIERKHVVPTLPADKVPLGFAALRANIAEHVVHDVCQPVCETTIEYIGGNTASIDSFGLPRSRLPQPSSPNFPHERQQSQTGTNLPNVSYGIPSNFARGYVLDASTATPFASATLQSLMRRVSAMGLFRDHAQRFNKTAKQAVSGQDLIDFLLSSRQVSSRVEGMRVGAALLGYKFLLPFGSAAAPAVASSNAAAASATPRMSAIDTSTQLQFEDKDTALYIKGPGVTSKQISGAVLEADTASLNTNVAGTSASAMTVGDEAINSSSHPLPSASPLSTPSPLFPLQQRGMRSASLFGQRTETTTGGASSSVSNTTGHIVTTTTAHPSPLQLPQRPSRLSKEASIAGGVLAHTDAVPPPLALATETSSGTISTQIKRRPVVASLSSSQEGDSKSLHAAVATADAAEAAALERSSNDMGVSGEVPVPATPASFEARSAVSSVLSTPTGTPAAASGGVVASLALETTLEATAQELARPGASSTKEPTVSSAATPVSSRQQPQQQEKNSNSDSNDRTLRSIDTTAANVSNQQKIWAEGWLVKQGHTIRNWRTRWFQLRGYTLAYFAAPQQPQQPQSAKRSIDIREYLVQRQSTAKHPSLILLTPRKSGGGVSLLMHGDTGSGPEAASATIDRWILALEEAQRAWAGSTMNGSTAATSTPKRT